MPTPYELALISLATFRLSLLISKEKGPYDVFLRLRKRLDMLAKHEESIRVSKIHQGVTCQWCVSLWMSAPMIAGWMILKGHSGFAAVYWVFVLWLVVSALAIVMN